MKYFAVVGRNKYWKYELEMIGAINVKIAKKNIVVFELQEGELGIGNRELDLPTLDTCNLDSQLLQYSQIIKRGQTMNKSDLFLKLEGTKVVGIDKKKYGTNIKRGVETVRRFKEIDLLHSDLEIKKDGKEVICIDGSRDLRGLVQGYQNISLFEKIDFEKPFSGMKIGMMPSKLALFLVNLGINRLKVESGRGQVTVWDPFAGFGTTGFVANYYGYNFIGSDLKITSLKGNWKWRNVINVINNEEGIMKSGKHMSSGAKGSDSDNGVEGSLKTNGKDSSVSSEEKIGLHSEGQDLPIEKTSNLPAACLIGSQCSSTCSADRQGKEFFTIFKHDVTNPFKQKFLTNVDVIVTEGRLGPILKNNYLPLSFLEECQEKVRKVQKGFLDNLLLFFGKDNFPVISMTIPYYFQNDTSNVKRIRERCQNSFLNLEVLDDIYHRKGQLVGRQIVVISKS